jgi:hypothetical protein
MIDGPFSGFASTLDGTSRPLVATVRRGTLGITAMAVMLPVCAAAPAMAGTVAEPTAPGPTVALPPPRVTRQVFAPWREAWNGNGAAPEVGAVLFWLSGPSF